MNTWIQALKAYNASKGGKYMIPKKGTKEYDEVRALMAPSEKMDRMKEPEKKKGRMIAKTDKFLKGYKDKKDEKVGPKMRKQHKQIMEILKDVLGKLQMD